MVIWSRHTPKWVNWLQNFKSKSPGKHPRSLLASNLPTRAKFGTFPSSFPSSRSLGPGRDHITTILSLFSPFQHPSHQHAAKKCPCPFCVSLPLKGRERKRKAVVINDDPVHTVDGDKDGDAKVAQKRPVKKQKSESADAKPRTKRAKDPSRKKKEVRVEETTKVACIDEPIREKMFPLRTRAKQHDDEVCSSARLQMPDFNYPNLNSLFPRWRFLRLPRGPRSRSR